MLVNHLPSIFKISPFGACTYSAVTLGGREFVFLDEHVNYIMSLAGFRCLIVVWIRIW